MFIEPIDFRVLTLERLPTFLGRSTCFVFARAHRRTGLATALLDAACAELRTQGVRSAESSPGPDATTDAEHHDGPLGPFTAAGFAFHREGGHGGVPVRQSPGDLPGAARA